MVLKSVCANSTSYIHQKPFFHKNVLQSPAGNSNAINKERQHRTHTHTMKYRSRSWHLTKADRYYTLGHVMSVVRASLNSTYDDISWLTSRPVSDQEAPLKTNDATRVCRFAARKKRKKLDHRKVKITKQFFCYRYCTDQSLLIVWIMDR